MANFLAFSLVTCFMPAVLVNGAEQAINCNASTTCGQCIQTYGCAWCAEPDLSLVRCQNENKTKCSKQFLINPVPSSNSSDSLVTGKPKTGSKKNSKSTIQTQKNIIEPQFINIALRPNLGHPLRVKLTYHHVPDYPLDVYYLIRASTSRKTDLLTLGIQKFADELKKKVKKITNNLRLGFGGFVQKPVTPFMAFVDSDKPESEPLFEFRNLLSLTNDSRSFTNAMNKLNVLSHINRPGGGLDAILQAIVCPSIGWRNLSRKLLVYSSDEGFHIAGDGKLLGIIEPNSGCCYLDKDGYYTKDTEQDYPSIAQINSIASNKFVSLIFTISPKSNSMLPEVIAQYNKLKDFIQGAYVAEQNNVRDVVRIITEQYEKMVSQVDMKEKQLPEQVRIRYFSKCLNSSSNETRKCEGLKINDKVNFELEIELLSCPSNPSQWNQQFYIQPAGINERVTVNLKMLCECDCNQTNQTVCGDHSPACSYHGTLKFGDCQCDSGYSGANCSCPYEEDDISNCRNKNNEFICSNRGVCQCNKCHCNTTTDETIFGEFCQCSNTSCPRVGGKLCADNGECNCNECQCHKGWTGDDCSCQNETTNCLADPLSGEICSGRGHCKCNKCICEKNEGYSGQFCDRCTASSCYSRCYEFDDCILCQYQGEKDCTDVCKDVKTELVDKYEDLNPNSEYIEGHVDRDNCKYSFSCAIYRKQIGLKILQHRSCDSGPAAIQSFVIGIVSAIVLIGFLCMMLWKIFVVIQDRREFAKFKEERANAQWKDSHNPLYVEPSKRYNNPMFENRSVLGIKETKAD